MEQYSKKHAKAILDLCKDNTAYFDGSMTLSQFDKIIFNVGFSRAEAIAITMALIIAGAKFSDIEFTD